MSVCVSIIYSFLSLSSIPLFHNLLIQLSVDGHLGCSQFWTITCKDVMNTNVQEFVGHTFPFLLEWNGWITWLNVYLTV